MFHLCAQTNTFNLLYSFSMTNINGVGPFGGLITSSNTLYGTTDTGGGAGYGTVFSINTDGSIKSSSPGRLPRPISFCKPRLTLRPEAGATSPMGFSRTEPLVSLPMP
jgi:uncharacterized repeat protein (TIGR03803 family)